MITKTQILEILDDSRNNEEAAERLDKVINPKVKADRIDFDAFLAFFNKVTGKKIRAIDPKAKRQINARLKEGYTKQDLAVAVINCFNNVWHHLPENRRHLTPEFISRPDKFILYLNDNNSITPPSLPEDWYIRELTEAQQMLLTENELRGWKLNRKTVEMDGGRFRPVKA